MSDIFHWPLSNGQEVCDYADHARIVAEAGAAVFAFHPEWTVTGMCDSDCLACRRLTELITEREKGYEEGKADAEQEHAAALAEATDRQRARDYVSLWSRLMLEDRKYRAALARAAIVIRQRLTDSDVFRLTGQSVRLHEWETVKPLPADKAAAPRTLTSDCLHLAEMYVGQSSRDNEYGRRSPVIECLACGALRLDDETVPPNRLAGGDFDTSGQPRTLTADDPEPAVGSVVLGRYEISGQRVMDDDEETTIWRFSDGGWCYEWATVQRMYGPVTLIHDGVATT